MTSRIDDFLRFCEGLRPGFTSDIRGASNADISQLEQVRGSPLPPLISDLLRAMGRNDGGLGLGDDGSLDIDEILHHYQDVGCCATPPGHMMLAPSDSWDVCVGELDDAPVVFSVDRLIVGLYAESLEKMLWRAAFNSFAVMPSSARAFAGERIGCSAGPGLADAGKLSMQLGYAYEWYSDQIVICGRRGAESQIAITQYADGPLCVNVGSNNRRDALLVAKQFCKKFGLELFHVT